MNFAQKVVAVFPHIIGWAALFLSIFLQNNLNDWEWLDYYFLFINLSIMGIAAYLNLYLLIPLFLFRKKYLLFTVFCALLVLLASLAITFMMKDSDNLDWFSRFVITIINLLFFLLMSSGARLLHAYFQNMMKLKEIENKQLKDELVLLKAQVNPHFLFNTLNNLYGLITQNQNQKASEITLKLADLMRYLLESSKSDTVSLKREIKFIEDYLGLEKIRLSVKAEIKFEISGIEKDVYIAPLLFIPLVENTFKHGLQTIAEHNFAHFSLALQGDELFFEAQNSYGYNLHNQPESGTGLKNLQKRLELIYPGKHQLKIEKTDTFYKVTLSLQL